MNSERFIGFSKPWARVLCTRIPGFTALFSTIGALRALSFVAFGGKIQAARCAGGL
jgi:hypothetical protein